MAQVQTGAREALKKLEDQLTCAICLEPYKDPKLLQCFHVFCEQCLVRLVVQDRQGQLSVRCPNCRGSTLLPAASVSGLQPAFHIHHLFDVKDTLEKEPQATNTNHVTGDVGKSVPPKKVTLYCRFHKERELELYCETPGCEELICLTCAVRLHNGHQYDLVSKTFEEHRKQITTSLEPVEENLDSANKAIEQIDLNYRLVTEQQLYIEAKIHQSIQRLHEALDERRTELIGQLNHMTQLKLKSLATQRDELEMIQTQLNSCLEFVRESLRTGSQGEVMNMKSPVVTQIKKMTADFNPDVLNIPELGEADFVSSPTLEQSVQEFGKIQFEQASAPKCYALGTGLESAVLDEGGVAVLHTFSTSGREYEIPVDNVNAELVSDFSTDSVKCDIQQLATNQYEISYQPTTRGRHKLHIKVEGEHIKGSPFPVTVKSLDQKLQAPISIVDGMDRPWGVALNQSGEIVVAESGRNCVSIFSTSGEKLQSLGSYGSGQGQFNNPRGVAVDGEDNILVVDGYNNRIQKFTKEGHFVTTVGKVVGKRPLEFYSPSGIAVHPHNQKVYVADTVNHRVQVLNVDLTFSSTFGSRGSKNGQLYNPNGIAIDNTGNVFVADSSNHRIQVFNADGKYLRKFGRHGQGNEELDFPSDLSIDSDDLVYVTESGNNRVSVFRSSGEFMTTFGTKGDGRAEFNKPVGVVTDRNGIVYISDELNHRVLIF